MVSVVGCLLYVGTGVLQPVIIDWLRLQDALGRRLLLLPTLASAMGMGACGFLASQSEWRTVQINRKRLLLTAGIDLASGMLLSGGLLLTGGSIFVVLYNSVPVWTALQARMFLGKSLNTHQFLGVFLVSIGLASTVFGSHEHLETTDDAATTQVVVGSAMALVGSFLHATMFILSEATVMSTSSSPVPSKIWCSLLGCLETCFMGLWVLLGSTLWGFYETDTSHSVKNAMTSPMTIAGGFLSLVVVNTIHAAAFFTLLQQVGAVGSALLKGLQAVTVVLVSAILFCGSEEAQCLTPNKTLSLALVLSGMSTYAYAGTRTKIIPEKEHLHK